MSGNTSMMLGGFAFEALGFGYQGIKRTLNTSWAEVAVGQTLNPQQWTGPTSDEITISGVIFTEEFGGQSQLDGIAAASLAGTPMMLVSGNAAEGVIQGTFTVQGIDEDRSYHNTRGVAARNAYTIKLKRQPDTLPMSSESLLNRATTFLSDLFR
ncbi:phage tail protein [Agrobacterium larrymoorei]|uniref:Phage tail protein n=1 Tax=Agrobacterium larrymoorei TaxID=160699 RepID=A0AAF0H854_9HYPH|nr:phage tail protein [Agrobacterium larrymoorei]WHA40907.1 phage tail protein [Agrobacterium larrymoorei]